MGVAEELTRFEGSQNGYDGLIQTLCEKSKIVRFEVSPPMIEAGVWCLSTCRYAAALTSLRASRTRLRTRGRLSR
jgi:hypothetical protein